MSFFIFLVLALQLIVITLIVYVLKGVLDRILIDSAIRKIESMRGNFIEKDLTQVSVVSYKPLSEENKLRLQNALNKKAQRVIPLIIERDKKLKGGIIIKIGTTIVDCSLINRLKESGIIR